MLRHHQILIPANSYDIVNIPDFHGTFDTLAPTNIMDKSGGLQITTQMKSSVKLSVNIDSV